MERSQIKKAYAILSRNLLNHLIPYFFIEIKLKERRSAVIKLTSTQKSEYLSHTQ
jgi:hypothetical protein